MYVILENKRSECKRFLKIAVLEEISKSKYFANQFNNRNTVDANIFHFENKWSEFTFGKKRMKKNQNDAFDFLSIEKSE